MPKKIKAKRDQIILFIWFEFKNFELARLGHTASYSGRMAQFELRSDSQFLARENIFVQNRQKFPSYRFFPQVYSMRPNNQSLSHMLGSILDNPNFAQYFALRAQFCHSI